MAKMRVFVIPKRRVIFFFVVLALVIASGIWYSVDSFRRAEKRRRERPTPLSDGAPPHRGVRGPETVYGRG